MVRANTQTELFREESNVRRFLTIILIVYMVLMMSLLLNALESFRNHNYALISNVMMPLYLLPIFISQIGKSHFAVIANQEGIQVKTGQKAQRKSIPYKDIASVEVFTAGSPAASHWEDAGYTGRSMQNPPENDLWTIRGHRIVAIRTHNGDGVRIAVAGADTLAALLHDMCHLPAPQASVAAYGAC